MTVKKLKKKNPIRPRIKQSIKRVNIFFSSVEGSVKGIFKFHIRTIFSRTDSAIYLGNVMKI
jgi:hypothetical protein